VVRFNTMLIWTLLLAGLVLSLLSATDLCNFGGCTDAHEYRLFGLHFAAVGTVFFIGSMVLFSLWSRSFLTRVAFIAAIGGGLGAELFFIHVQKNIIGAWCPRCLLIAATVAATVAATGLPGIVNLLRGEQMTRRKIITTATFFTLLVTGFFISMAGLGKGEAEAALDISVGKRNSHLEVIIFTDWYCPACEKVEPVLLFTFPQLAQKARIYFVDKPIHKESTNFIPYNLSFALHEKEKYPSLRRALATLAHQTKNPSAEQVQKAVAPLGVTFTPLSFLEITQGMAEYESRIKEFNVRSTPTVIFRNTRNGKTRTLSATNQITAPNLLKTLQEIDR
jgi:hypothetical protein